MILGETINNQLYKIVELKRQLWEAEKELTRLNNQFAYGLLACSVMNIEAPLHYEAPKPLVSVVEIPAKTALSSDLGRVHVDWSGRGFTSGNYAVLAEDETRYKIEISSDEKRPMALWVARTRCQKVEAVVEAKAA